MSRVVYSDQTASVEQESLRAHHHLRLVSGAEEGMGVDALPRGVYGFTYSPGLVNSPLFAVRRFRSYEIHKLADGETFIVGFATPEAAAELETAAEATILVQPEADEEASVQVRVPYSRIRRHRGYSAPNERGFQVAVG